MVKYTLKLFEISFNQGTIKYRITKSGIFSLFKCFGLQNPKAKAKGAIMLGLLVIGLISPMPIRLISPMLIESINDFGLKNYQAS